MGLRADISNRLKPLGSTMARPLESSQAIGSTARHLESSHAVRVDGRDISNRLKPLGSTAARHLESSQPGSRLETSRIVSAPYRIPQPAISADRLESWHRSETIRDVVRCCQRLPLRRFERSRDCGLPRRCAYSCECRPRRGRLTLAVQTMSTVTPLVQNRPMSDRQSPPSVADLPEDVVEPWWCPVCNGAAHRTRRPGRPKLYCSNACRQRAYRWRRDHQARTIARPGHPAAGALVPFGRWHALRTGRDSWPSSAIAAAANPQSAAHSRARSPAAESHRPPVRHRQLPTPVERCIALIVAAARPARSAHHRARGTLRPAAGRIFDSADWMQRLDPTHPIRRHPERYGQMTRPWLRPTSVTSHRTNDPPR